MDERNGLHNDWTIVSTGIRYLVGKISSPVINAPYNAIVLEDAFELMIMRGQQKNGETVLMVQNNAWTTLPLCVGGTTMHVMWTERIDVKDMSEADKVTVTNFINSAHKDFENNKMVAAGLAVAKPSDVAKINKSRA